MGDNLGFLLLCVSVFSSLAVASWAKARQREREALYKSEAIKKIAEMQGNIPEPVLQVLRDALTPDVGAVRWLDPKAFYREREMHYRHETLKKIAEFSGSGAENALAYLHEHDKTVARRRQEGFKLGGLITTAAGIGLLIAFKALVTEAPVYLVALIPIFVGLVLFGYGSILAPRD